MDDIDTWIRDYQQGDLQALERVIDATRRPLYAFALRLTAHPETAEDIVQETWLKAIRQIDRYRGGKFLSWLFRIAHNTVIDSARKRKPEVSIHQPAGIAEQTLEEKLPAPGRNPREEAALHDSADRIQWAVDQLSDDQKTLFLMRTESELPFKEIASILGIPLNTALARMHYALGHLRRLLSPDKDTL